MSKQHTINSLRMSAHFFATKAKHNLDFCDKYQENKSRLTASECAFLTELEGQAKIYEEWREQLLKQADMLANDKTGEYK